MNGPDYYPPPPPFLPLTRDAERQRIFGPIQYELAATERDPDAVRIMNGWAEHYLTTATIPQLRGLTGAPRSGRVAVHRLAALPLESLWASWAAAGLVGRVLTFDGLYVPRLQRGDRPGRPLSNHSWGTAFDINAAFNPLGKSGARVGDPGCVRELVTLANAHGWYWGGHYLGRRDEMHFELALVPN